jgi:hypothetical protein
MQIPLCGAYIKMTSNVLYVPNAKAFFQQVSGIAVPQRMSASGLLRMPFFGCLYRNFFSPVKLTSQSLQ